MRRPKRLYDARVCRRCFSSFANRRQCAYVVDTIFYGLALWVVLFGVGTSLAVFSPPEHVVVPLMLGLMALLYVGYPLMFLGKDGLWSPGRKMFGLIVVHQASGVRIGFWRSVLRNLVLVIPFMPLYVAFDLVTGKRLGDGWANTRVVWKRYENHPLFTGLPACAVCNYDLTGNTTGVCPECGTPIAIKRWQVPTPPIQQAA
jgi:uncharacterized RDD family membrane protein YckC